MRISLILLLMFYALIAHAQREVIVCIDEEYKAPTSLSVEVAKQNALDRAKISAIENEFGSIVTQDNTTLISNSSSETCMEFISLGGSKVKGEWVETIGEPQFKFSFKDDFLIVSVKVSGKIREIQPSSLDFEMKVLCNGVESKFERLTFMNGDDMYLYFNAPMNGYAMAFMVDYNTNLSYCLLPYRRSSQNLYSIRKDKPYVFFSKERAESIEAPVVDEYTMTCTTGAERNDIYVVFSQSPFKNPPCNVHDGLRYLDNAKFIKWLADLNRSNQDIKVKHMSIVVNK